MGGPKLLLPLNGGTLIEKTLAAWKKSRVERTVVVVRPLDAELASLCWREGVEVVIPPAPPPQMSDSVRWGLTHLASQHHPAEDDAWLLAPADMPGLSTDIINALIEAHDPREPRILVPTLGGKRGHPVLFPWALAAEVHALRPEEGLNVLRQRHESREVACDHLEPRGPKAFEDIDTPDDYRQLQP